MQICMERFNIRTWCVRNAALHARIVFCCKQCECTRGAVTGNVDSVRIHFGVTQCKIDGSSCVGNPISSIAKLAIGLHHLSVIRVIHIRNAAINRILDCQKAGFRIRQCFVMVAAVINHVSHQQICARRSNENTTKTPLSVIPWGHVDLQLSRASRGTR